MKLYHGTNMAFSQVDLAECRPNKDFGRGFYLTPVFDDAVHMARRTVRRYGGRPFVMSFEFDEASLAGVSVRRFDEPTEGWAMFVMANRRADATSPDHNLDERHGLVVGPIANDDLAMLFRQFERGLVTTEMLIHAMRFKRLTIQYSFHTEAALRSLKLLEVVNV